MIQTWTVERAGVRGWLVVDSLQGGLAFGGTRFSPDVTRAEVEELARCMTWKLAAHGMPTGGAKAGLAVDPRDPDLPRKLAVFAAGLREPLSTCAIIGRDLGATNAMLDAIYAAIGRPQLHLIQKGFPACPDRIRDLPGYRVAMTGQGVAWATRALIGGRALTGARVAVQGCGVVGLGSARRLAELGATIVSISDAAGAWMFPQGATWDRLSAAVADGGPGSVARAVEAPRESTLHAACDVLVLAARSHSVGAADAERIQARLVVEGANFGLTPDAREVLAQRGVVVLPDILANSAAAAMTTRQLAAGGQLDDPTLWNRIEAAIETAVRRAASHVARHGGTLRAASRAPEPRGTPPSAR